MKRLLHYLGELVPVELVLVVGRVEGLVVYRLHS